MGSVLMNVLALVFLVVLSMYLFGTFAVEELRRKKEMKNDEDEFERKMNELAANPAHDPDNFVLDLDTPDLCVDECAECTGGCVDEWDDEKIESEA